MKLSEKLIEWTKEWFAVNDRKTAVIGISGGKDSAVVAAVLVHAIGKENVFGVLMPNGVQSDIADSLQVVNELGINHTTINIGTAYGALIDEISEQIVEPTSEAKINISPRLRMTTLYAVAQTLSQSQEAKACVVGTGNAAECYVGYFTKWGDGAHDLNLLRDLWVHEVLQVGDELGYFPNIIHKAPADGLSGSTDEQRLGVTYEEVYRVATNQEVSKEAKEKIDRLHRFAQHKLNPSAYFKNA